MSIGARLYNLRVDRELSVAELAGRFGVSRYTVYRWENNQYVPNRPVLVELAEFYGVSIDWILQGIDSDEGDRPEPGDSADDAHLMSSFGSLSQQRQVRFLRYLNALYNKELSEEGTDP